MIRFFCLLLLVSAWWGCGSSGEKGVSQTKAPKRFKMVEVPVLLENPDERAMYIAKNYWKNFDFTDTTYINQPEVTEQAFADYINLIAQMAPDAAALSIQSTLSQAQVDTGMFRHFEQLFDKYLYDPNSPMRNESLYIYVLETLIASDQIPDIEKERSRYRLNLARKNRPEMPAHDFTYTQVSGATGTLYGIKADYLILFINNPGCKACKETTESLVHSKVVSRLIKDKELKVLALYPDEDVKAWRDYLPQMPGEWINGYDASLRIKQEELYDLRAIPTLYLLDAKKQVILKDAPFPAIEAYLNSHVTPS